MKSHIVEFVLCSPRLLLLFRAKSHPSAMWLQVNQRFPTMPFTLRAGDERNWRMGVVECVKHALFTEYPVLFDKVGVLIVPTFPVLIGPMPWVYATSVGGMAHIH